MDDDQNVTGDDTPEKSGQQAEGETGEGEGAAEPEAGATFSHSDLVGEAAQIYEGFDPAVHAVNPDGTPRKKSDGGFAMKRGRKPGQTAAPAGAPATAATPRFDPGPAKSPKAARQAGVVTNTMAAKYIFAATTSGLAQVLGPEWLPESQEEADGMRAVIKDYFDAHGQVQISPETMLLFSVIGYSAPRVTHENTRGKIARAFEWAKSAFGAIFRR